MSSQSEYAGTAGTKNFHTGTQSWTSPTNAQGSPDGSLATCTVQKNGTSDSLDVYDWGFSIPGGATIDGVSATWTALKGSGSGNPSFSTAIFIECGSTSGAFTTNSLSGTALTGSSASYTTGGSTDLAGLSSQLTVSNVNSNVENTGITLGAEFTETTNNLSAAEVDACQCTVYYTAGGGGAGGDLLTMMGCGG